MTDRRMVLKTFAAAAAAGATWFDAFATSAKAGYIKHIDFAGLPMGIQSYSLRAFKVDEALKILKPGSNVVSLIGPPDAAFARARGMTDAQHGELMAVIAMASQTNALATALQVEPDGRFTV